MKRPDREDKKEGSKQLTPKKIWDEYQAGLDYNNSIQLNETVRVNENFFVGKQWEGVESNGLPTPVFNFLKRVTLFTVASNTSENIKLKATPLTAAGSDKNVKMASEVANAIFESLFEKNKISALIREYMRNAAVDGDAAMYTWWNPDIDAGNGKKGEIVTEIINNTRVFFGNVADRRVQTQPYILIKRREMTNKLRIKAKKYGCQQWEEIKEDTDEQYQDYYKDTGGKTTVIMRMWRDDDTDEIWACEAVEGIIIRKPWNLGLKLYPLTWLCWDYVQDNYHGQAMLTGLIPNQIYINKTFAMAMISLMTTAYPKVVYDKTRVQRWDNRIGQAIGINGGGVDNVARILDPAQISPQIAQFIQLAQDMTQSNLGATSVALGDTRPDNTSAIIALQRAASTPNELTKQNLYQSIEELGQIYLDFMGEYYGTRPANVSTSYISDQVGQEVMNFVGDVLPQTNDGKTTVDFDYKIFKKVPMMLKLDVGASAYWSEIASTQTLDNLLTLGQIDIIEYLERVPDGYITDRQGLINSIKARRGMAVQQMPMQDSGGGNEPNVEPPPQQAEAQFNAIPTRGGQGNGELQRALTNMAF